MPTTTYVLRRAACCLAALLASAAMVRATDPGYGYATDDGNRIVSVNLSTGTAVVYNGSTIFGANALGYADNYGAEGSVIYASSASSGATYGELAVWNRATNTHTDIGNLFSTYNGTASPVTAGTTISDAAYWNGVTGPAAGYYVVGSNHNIYRIAFNVDNATPANIISIASISLAGTIPTTVLTKSFAFGDIAFNPTDGTLFLSDSNNGFSSFNLSTGVAKNISTRYDGQIAFGQDDQLYGVGNLAGTANTQGNAVYQISLTDGSVTSIAANTDPSHYYTDFSGAAAINIVPEPSAFGMAGLAGVLAAGMTVLGRRRKA